jgi:hypothetical protein
MAVVLEAMPFSAAWRKRQNRIQAIQRLDGALLVHAEDSGMRRWFEVQADDVRGFLFKLRIITGHITARPVRLEPKLPPHSTDRRLADTHLLGKPIATPVGRSVRWSAPGQLQNARLSLRSPTAVLGPTVTRIQAAQAFLLKAFLPKTNVTIGATDPLTDFTVRVTRSQPTLSTFTKRFPLTNFTAVWMVP